MNKRTNSTTTVAAMAIAVLVTGCAGPMPVAHTPAFLQAHQIPAKGMKTSKKAEANTMLKFGLKRLVEANANYQFYLDRSHIDSAGVDFSAVKKYFIQELMKESDVQFAFDNETISAVNMPAEFKEMFQKGFNHKLAGDVQVVYKPGYFFGSTPMGTTHGSNAVETSFRPSTAERTEMAGVMIPSP